MIPSDWNIDPASPEAKDIISTIQNLYFGGPTIREVIDYVDYTSDLFFHRPTQKTIEMMAAAQTHPIYSYIFAFEGLLNLPKTLLLLSGYPGAMHADDIPYLFKVASLPAPVLPGSATYVTRHRLLEMWANFAKTGNPTPQITTSLPVLWPRVGKNQEYLDIDKDLIASTWPLSERMSTWKALDAKYGP